MANKEVQARVRFPAGGVYSKSSTPIEVTVGKPDAEFASDTFPCKEWCVTDDMMALSDAASVSIANIEGENSGKFVCGQRIEIEESDPDVANGQWTRHFTGVVTSLRTYIDASGGANILIGAMDLGWHLTSGCAKPLTQIKNKPFNKFLDLLLDPSWKIGPIVGSNDRNKLLKHGRQVVIINHQPVLGAVLKFIQVEPGQKPFELISTYAARDGFLVNIGARGELIFFRPHYDAEPLYRAVMKKIGSTDHYRSNLRGRAELTETIDGLFTETQCWSTVVIPPRESGTTDEENPNEVYRHNFYRPKENPLPFFRREVFSDSEAISKKMRTNRAIWRNQMGLFNSWTYEVEFQGHSQRPEDGGSGAFFTSDTMISVDDEIEQVSGVYYVQSVRRSHTLKDGAISKLTIRRPGLLNPALAALPDSKKVGGGAKKAAKPKTPIP